MKAKRSSVARRVCSAGATDTRSAEFIPPERRGQLDRSCGINSALRNLLILGLLGALFWFWARCAGPDLILFSNDAPLGILNAEWRNQFGGLWEDTSLFGRNLGSRLLDLTLLIEVAAVPMVWLLILWVVVYGGYVFVVGDVPGLVAKGAVALWKDKSLLLVNLFFALLMTPALVQLFWGVDLVKLALVKIGMVPPSPTVFVNNVRMGL